jgi:hypothetical protein
MAWRKAVLAAGTVLFLSAPSWAGFSPYDDDLSSYDPYDYQADSHDPHWLMDESSGCWAYDSNAGATNAITWSGDCRNGRAEGDGTLTFFERGHELERLTGTFADGMLQDGHVEIAWSDGSSYTGEEVRGQFNGRGLLIASDGTRYDGQWRDDNFVGQANRNPYLTGNGSADDGIGDHASNDRSMQAEQAPPAQTQMSVHWAFLDGTQAKFASADGSELSFTLESGGALKRTITHADGSVAGTTFAPENDTAGSVRNERGDVLASYRLEKNAVDIAYANGRTERVAGNGAGGLTVTATPPGGLSIRSDWYPENRKPLTAQNNVALPAPQRATPVVPASSKPAMAIAAPSTPLLLPSLKPRLAVLSLHAVPVSHAAVAREEAPVDVRRVHETVREAKSVDSPIHPSMKPERPTAVASDEGQLRVGRHRHEAHREVEIAANLPQPEEKPSLHIPKKHERRGHTHVDVASTESESQPVAMHTEVLPPAPEVHAEAIPDLRIEVPPAVPPVARPAVAAPPASAPVRAVVANATPSTPAAQPVHIAALHTIGVQEPALRRSASDCLSVESNGTHWGFRNNCVTDIQFAYCVKNGADRLTACSNSAVPGSVAAHGFTSLIADLSLKDPSASHAFRWVACLGGAGEVVPRLDQSDPPMGRCLHTSDLPSGVERADVAKRNGKQ